MKERERGETRERERERERDEKREKRRPVVYIYFFPFRRSNMFWRVQGEEQASPIETILDKEDFTLEELLLEEDVIQEVKAMNERLTDFLHTRVGDLCNYIVEPHKAVKKLEKQLLVKQLKELEEEKKGAEGQEEADVDDDGEEGERKSDEEASPHSTATPEPLSEEDLQHYALQTAQRVCEIMCCEVEEILQATTGLLDYLFSFLDQEKPLDSVLSGYYSRVMVSIAQRRPLEISECIQSNPDILVKLVDHLYSYSITEFILRLISGDEQNALYQKEQGNEWLVETSLLDILVQKVTQVVSNEGDGEEKVRLHFNTIQNAVSCLVGIANTAPSAIGSQLQEPKVTEALLRSIDKVSPPNTLIAVVDVLIAMLQPRQAKHTLSPDVIISYGAFSPAMAVEETIDAAMIECAGQIMEKMEDLCGMLKAGEGEQAFETSYGKVPCRLGMRRWKILDLISKVLNIVEPEKCIRMTKETKIIPTCFAMMYEMPFNSMLHNVVQSIVFGLLGTENRDLMISLIDDCKLHHLVSSAPPEIDTTRMELRKEGKPLRAGYFGVVTSIANQILSFAATDTEVEKKLEDDIQWTSWVVDVLVAQNKIEDPTSWECGRPSHVNDILGDMGSSNTVDLSMYSGLTVGASGNDNDNDRYEDNNDDFDVDDLDEDDVYDSDDVVSSFQRLSTTEGELEDDQDSKMNSLLDQQTIEDNVVLVSSEEGLDDSNNEAEADVKLIQEKQKIKRADTPAGTPGVIDAQFNSANFWRSAYTFDIAEEE